MAKDKEYDVGYGKPPKHGQFQSGISGNPKGRPKGSQNLRTDVKEILNEMVPVSAKGRTRMMSTQRATLLRLVEKALKGDSRSLDRSIGLAQTYNDEDIAETSGAPLPSSDEAILKNYLERHNRGGTETEETVEPTNDNDSGSSEEPGSPEDNEYPEENDDDDDWLQ